jgi:hypothetical protein
MQGCKTRIQGEVLKSYSPKSHKATNAMEELERMNKSGGQPMTPISRTNGFFPSLRGGIDWWRLYI